MGMPGRRLWDQFLGKLWDLNSLDALHKFFGQSGHLLAPSKQEKERLAELGVSEEEDSGIRLWPNSPLGTFVRRMRLEFFRLQFSDFAELWKSFVRYRQPTAHYLKRKTPGFGRLSFDNVLLLGEQEDWGYGSTMELASVAYGDMLTGDESSTLPVSTDDVENLLEFQIEQMQSRQHPTLTHPSL